MPTHDPEFKPVALPDQVVKLVPSGEFRRVRAVEPLPLIDPVDFGSVTANGENGPNGNQVTELELAQDTVGQYRVSVLSDVEVELLQTGKQEQRLTNANTVAKFAPTSPSQTNEFYVFEANSLYFKIKNQNPYQMDRSLVSFTGYKLDLDKDPIPEDQVPGQPVHLPIDKIDKTAQATTTAGGRTAQSPRSRGGR